MCMTQVGIKIGWASPNLARLISNDSSIPLTDDQASWVASFTGLGGFFGGLLGSTCIELISSKKTIAFALSLNCVSWICLVIANTYEWIYAARITAGINTAMAYCCFSIYLGEVAPPKIRGTLISIAAGGNPFGVIIGTIAETYLAMKMSSSIYLAMSLSTLVLILWLDESPYHLVKKRNFESAKNSIGFYFGDCDKEKELEEVKKFVEASGTLSITDKFKELKRPVIRKSLFLIFILFGLPHVSGTMTITAYMEIILKNSKSFLVEPKNVVIYANITSVIAAALSVKLIDKLGRKWLLLLSSTGTATGMVGLSIHFFLLGSDFDSKNIQWLPIVSILLYLITYSIGFSTVPSTVLGEIFPENVKSIAVCVASMSASLFGFVAPKMYQPMSAAVGEEYVFLTHAVLALLAIPCAIFIMPETKAKTLQEIQDELGGK